MAPIELFTMQMSLSLPLGVGSWDSLRIPRIEWDSDGG